jgi:drug/metabolite transporter (DMT)-like permease
LNAAIANVIYTQEMTGAILLAWLILGEVPGVNAVVGAIIMLVGILFVLLP